MTAYQLIAAMTSKQLQHIFVIEIALIKIVSEYFLEG